MLFEISKCDLAGRIGTLETNHGRVKTPAFVPVIHPVKQSIPASKLKQMGFDLVITNAYITMKNYGDIAVQRGIHDIIGYDGAVMTDSGGYQVLEYGKVDVTPEAMASFETGIGSDIAIPLDKPTGFGMLEKKAKEYVNHTLTVCKQTLNNAQRQGQIWAGPIQGGEHEKLVKYSAKSLVKMGYEFLALGSPVEFMEAYEYVRLAEMIVAARRSISDSSPMHLFGAGHPLTIALAVSLGCDTFDSASYMLYAKQDRYITEDRTRKIGDIEYFSCPCEICSKTTPAEIVSMEKQERVEKIALHNLYSIKSEVDRTKEAIADGRLWEHLMKKMHSHPKLYEARYTVAASQDIIAPSTPQFKKGAVFLYEPIDQYRPEVLSYHDTVRKFKTRKKILCISRDSTRKPAYLAPEQIELEKYFEDHEKIQFCRYSKHLGLLPLEISDLYPAAHYVEARTRDAVLAYPEFAKTWEKFFSNNSFDTVYYTFDEFLLYYVRRLPKGVQRRKLLLD
ncbi:MAG: tRNA-guanine transglycosylase [Cenarchaeum symbiont of Oopsacas minuta]|nr:tRNA-guanine transglycosylase [Cenarchaeum symbiont of Oopsacas minuta]